MTKKEKIQEAWENFPMVNHDENDGFAISYCIDGVTDILDNPYGKIEWEALEADLIKWRPISLKGIEDNNGWIRIESEEQYDELENGEYEWYNINNGKYDKGDLWTYGIFTHYKIVPIVKSDAPLY